ncbi:MAG TPA: L-serine ammonia-lyase, iron-sulfur-dependent, subunit alpha [Candidatus Scybalocola faecigallinarum]|uniref:L-serine dehydratase n=1 Tax=Candidatus Scybalocola faecigallinarum TaxID=2840941 RepID=A0A9D1F5K2_9FIRM|nr:L-serine ammonia-lyase, iron-sulfur-dependent, subunit alpha [Candidatus Scybalocola faecigallinarum]
MYNTVSELCKLADEKNTAIWEIVLENEKAVTGKSREDIFAELKVRFDVMEKSAHKALDRPHETVGNLIRGSAFTQNKYTTENGGICGPFMNRAMALALSCCEINAAMGKICAAPTAGSCGILPAVLISMKERYALEEDKVYEGMLTASGIGAVVMKNATVAGAEGGCQAECGVAAAMAAAAAVHMCGGTSAMCANACGFALMNVMGLVCDPVAGLVQLPCAMRNASQAVNALICADMALSGAPCLIPVDEIIEAMYRVGKALPSALKETAEGGLAATPEGKRISKEIFGK